MIKVERLCFGYGKQLVLNEISFSAEKGTVTGFLGPSGAGKSTLQKILTAQIRDYEGIAEIAGVACKEQSRGFYEKIGVDFEFSTCYEKYTARENLKYFGGFYETPLRDVDELLGKVGLLKDGDKKVAQYSKGMRSRLNFIKALLHNPEILFLDEPTSGLDPISSRQMKDLIRAEKETGKTVILTTHNMHDAGELCDQVAFLSDGKIQAFDTPRNLVMRTGAEKLRYAYRSDHGEVLAECSLRDAAADEKFMALLAGGLITSVHSTEPTLNDVFAEVTGRRLDHES